VNEALICHTSFLCCAVVSLWNFLFDGSGKLVCVVADGRCSWMGRNL